MTTIVHKRGTGIPAADDLAVGEIAIDTSTGTAYTKTNAGEVVSVGGEVDLSTYVSTDTTINPNATMFNGGYQHFRWGSSGSQKYDIRIGQNGVTPSIGMESGFFMSGTHPNTKVDWTFEINEYGAVATKGMNITGNNTGMIAGFKSIQASDFLDADGNSILGGGGGGGIDFPEADEGYAFLATPSGWHKFDGYSQSEWLYKRSGTAAMCWEGKKGHNTMAYQKTITAGFENTAAGKYDILIGNNNYDMGAYPTGYNILIGTNNQCVQTDGAIAIGKDHMLMPGDENAIGFAIGEGNTVEGSGIAIGRNVSARSGQVIIGEKQISFADDLVEAFTTLQSAIKDESTLEGVKGALTNALGGLIEKFEQKARVEPLQRMSAEEAEAAGQSARARLDA